MDQLNRFSSPRFSLDQAIKYKIKFKRNSFSPACLSAIRARTIWYT